jgi:hypothetical protein
MRATAASWKSAPLNAIDEALKIQPPAGVSR